MMVFQELTIRATEKDSRDLVEYVSLFVERSHEYEYLRKQTLMYRRAIDSDAIVAHAVYAEPYPSIHFATSDGASLQLTNIVPQSKSELSVEEYNSFLNSFEKSLKAFAKEKKWGLLVKSTSAELTLKSAISGAKTRSKFEMYLAHHPLSHHFYDVRRLDEFICSASSHSRGKVDVDRIGRYLNEILNWSIEDVEWCVNRIRIGLEVLDAKRGRR